MIRKILFHWNDFNIPRYTLRMNMFCKKNYNGIKADSPEAQRYLRLLMATFNYSYVNRAFISDFIQKALRNNVKKPIAMSILADVSHERIDYENSNDKQYWLHRNGASRVEYSETNKYSIVPLPGYPGGPSLLCIPQKGLKNSFSSVNHGAGRRLTKTEAKNIFEQKLIYEEFKSKNIKLYKIGNENICEQAPAAFKDVMKVVEVLKDSQLTKPVALVKPLAIIKG